MALTAIAGTAGIAAHQEQPTNGAPSGKQDCRNGGYAAFGFSNQGHCISFVARQNRGHGYSESITNTNAVDINTTTNQSARSGNANGSNTGNASNSATTSTSVKIGY